MEQTSLLAREAGALAARIAESRIGGIVNLPELKELNVNLVNQQKLAELAKEIGKTYSDAMAQEIEVLYRSGDPKALQKALSIFAELNAKAEKLNVNVLRRDYLRSDSVLDIDEDRLGGSDLSLLPDDKFVLGEGPSSDISLDMEIDRNGQFGGSSDISLLEEDAAWIDLDESSEIASGPVSSVVIALDDLATLSDIQLDDEFADPSVVSQNADVTIDPMDSGINLKPSDHGVALDDLPLSVGGSAYHSDSTPIL